MRMTLWRKKKTAPTARIIDDDSLETLRNNIDEIAVVLPLKREGIDRICEWFQDKEIEMSNALCDGVNVDRDELGRSSRTADAFRILGGDAIDLEDLNRRLGCE